MTAKKVAFIVNPNSGVRKNALEVTRSFLNGPGTDGVEVVLESTRAAGDASRLAARFSAEHFDTVVSVGGDGTMNETAAGLLGTDTALGVVPFGSGNGFARSLGIPLDPAKALNIAIRGNRTRVDVGTVKDGSELRYFFGLAGIGFDAHVAKIFNETGGKRGFSTYIKVVSREYRRYRPNTMNVSIDGESRALAPLVLAVTNTREYGNGAIISPHALYDDGLFDIVMIDRMSTAVFFWNLPHFFNGTIDRVRAVRIERGKRVAISAGEPVVYHTDGEPFVTSGNGELVFQMSEEGIFVNVS